MKTHEFECEDEYEAEKLASLASVQKDGSVWLTAVVRVVGKEIVLQLKDKSSHAVVLRTDVEARRLGQLLSDVFIGKASLISGSSVGRLAAIVLD